MVCNEDGLITHAEMKLGPHYPYLRVTMADAEGKRAWSNPIFLK